MKNIAGRCELETMKAFIEVLAGLIFVGLLDYFMYQIILLFLQIATFWFLVGFFILGTLTLMVNLIIVNMAVRITIPILLRWFRFLRDKFTQPTPEHF